MTSSANKQRLNLNKQTVTELNHREMQDVDGGTSLVCVGIGITISLAITK